MKNLKNELSTRLKEYLVNNNLLIDNIFYKKFD